MSDPKPYTMNECPVWHGTVASVHLGRVRATVEALEQERVEYAAEAQRHDETKAALLEAQRERDALVRERDEARADAALLRIALENAEPIEAERDLLRAEVEHWKRVTDEERRLADLRGEMISRLEFERDEARRDRNTEEQVCNDARADAAKAEAEVERLKAALRDFVRHGCECAFNTPEQGECAQCAQAREALKGGGP